VFDLHVNAAYCQRAHLAHLAIAVCSRTARHGTASSRTAARNTPWSTSLACRYEVGKKELTARTFTLEAETQQECESLLLARLRAAAFLLAIRCHRPVALWFRYEAWMADLRSAAPPLFKQKALSAQATNVRHPTAARRRPTERTRVLSHATAAPI
jgi:hypothetical protein